MLGVLSLWTDQVCGIVERHEGTCNPALVQGGARSRRDKSGPHLSLEVRVFFKPEDFNWGATEFGSSSMRVKLADFCNTKLERGSKVVYGILGQVWGEINQVPGEGFKSIEFNREPSRHKALLINIEPIEKCQHPKEKISYVFGIGLKLEEMRFPGPQKYEPGHWACECGVEVKPSGFEEVK